MDVNGSSDIDALTAGDLVAEAVAWGLQASRAGTVVRDTLEGLRLALQEETLLPGASERAHAVMSRRTQCLLDGRPGGGG
jgi:hypothetical protein